MYYNYSSATDKHMRMCCNWANSRFIGKVHSEVAVSGILIVSKHCSFNFLDSVLLQRYQRQVEIRLLLQNQFMESLKTLIIPKIVFDFIKGSMRSKFIEGRMSTS